MKRILSIFYPVLLASLTPLRAAPVSSTFDRSAEDWSVVGDAATPATFNSTGGHPGGCITVRDSVNGGTIYFTAPQKFLGDRSDAYGTNLSFDLRQVIRDSPDQFDAPDVLLQGAGLTLAYNTPSNPAIGSWTSYRVLLMASAGWHLNNLSGAAATETQMQAVLGDLQALRIRGEYQSGADTDSLDNVRMGGVTVRVTSPAANGHVVGRSATLRGTASATAGVARVEILLNGSPQDAVLVATPGGANWSLGTTPLQGMNTLVVRAYDANNESSNPVALNFAFAELRPELAGNYYGLVTATDPGTALVQSGLMVLTVGSTGSFTGRAEFAGATVRFSGLLLTDGHLSFGHLRQSTIPLDTRTRSFGVLSLALATDHVSRISGTLTSDDNQQTIATVSLDQGVYTALSAPVSPQLNVPLSLLDPARDKGAYTVLFPAAAAPNNALDATAYPQGDGHATLRLSTRGTVKIVGKLADGTVISYGSGLSVDRTCPVFVHLYGKGFVSGQIAFDSSVAVTDASADLTWLKPAGLPKQKLYPAGWPSGIALSLIASKYVVPAAPTAKWPAPPNPDTVLGPGLIAAASPTTTNIIVGAEDGGIEAAESNDTSISERNKVTTVQTTAGSAPLSGLSASFTVGTGYWHGTFVHPATGKAVPYSGIAFQKTHSASGYFLYLPGKGAPFGSLSGSGGIHLLPQP